LLRSVSVSARRIAALTVAMVATFTLASRPAAAYPEGAPWGAANPAAKESCASCHYDYDPVADSVSIQLEGLPAAVEPASEHAFILRFVDPQAAVSGFQLLATSAETPAAPAGQFLADAKDIETIGGAARSTATRDAQQGFVWQVTWRAPADASGDLVMYVAASAANDDQSPFGDTIHYRRFPLTVRRDPAADVPRTHDDEST